MIATWFLLSLKFFSTKTPPTESEAWSSFNSTESSGSQTIGSEARVAFDSVDDDSLTSIHVDGDSSSVSVDGSTILGDWLSCTLASSSEGKLPSKPLSSSEEPESVTSELDLYVLVRLFLLLLRETLLDVFPDDRVPNCRILLSFVLNSKPVEGSSV